MGFSLSWIDHDEAARERSLRILALFQERESRDELGLGGVRDSFSDRLFPGTSTIQTRLRYMLFVPWMYQQLESKRVSSAEITLKARKEEVRLIQPLLDSENERGGVFGRMAGGGLKRLPSSIYWNGLGSWGVRLFQGFQDHYHRSLDAIYQRRDLLKVKDPGDDDGVPLVATWSPKIPTPPAGFPEKVDFMIRREEAEFLLDRIKTSHPESLLAFLALHGEPAGVSAPWAHPQFAEMPAPLRELIDHARRFSVLMHGAAILYNVALSDLAGSEERQVEHRERLSEWAADLDLEEFRAWTMTRLWELAASPAHTITRSTVTFVEAWRERVLQDASGLAEDAMARALVEARERRLKGPRSRFANSRVRDQWSGQAGVGQLKYRWGTVQTLLADLYAGLGRE